MTDQENKHSEEPESGGKRKRQKIRIKYRQRIKIEKRPKGFKIKQLWKKKKKNLIFGTILSVLFAVTLFMVAKVVKHKVEMNKLEKDIKSFVPE